jgi:DNA polymerase-3 subunit alpha
MALIIDTETNGLPDCTGLRWGEYPVYNDLSKYNAARIVQFTFMVCGTHFEEKELHDYIIRRDGFSIENQQFHGITNEISDNNGISFVEAANIFSTNLSKVSHIVAHNIAFDINVIKSELYRHNLHHIIEEMDKKKLLCTMKHTKPILRIINQYGNFKNPSLAELYQYNFLSPIENAHNSKYDVINLHKIVKNMYDKKILNYRHRLVYTEHIC